MLKYERSNITQARKFYNRLVQLKNNMYESKGYDPRNAVYITFEDHKDKALCELPSIARRLQTRGLTEKDLGKIEKESLIESVNILKTDAVISELKKDDLVVEELITLIQNFINSYTDISIPRIG